MDITFRPTNVNRSGAQLVQTTTQLDAVTTIAANTTTRFNIATPFNNAYLVNVGYQTTTIAADADGTILLSLIKRDNQSTPADVALSSTFSLESGTVALTEKVYNVPITATLTDAQRTFKTGDVLVASVANNSAAIDTQHAQALVTCQWALLK